MRIITLIKRERKPTIYLDMFLMIVTLKSRIHINLVSENSSVGRALPCQGKGRGFESRFSLQ